MAAPIDLNILWTGDKDAMRKKIKMAMKLGYETIAINNADDQVTVKSSKKFASLPTIKHPKQILPSEEEIKDMKKSLGVKKEIQVKSRITVVFSSVDQVKRLQSDETIRAYDLVAVQPDSEKNFQMCCLSLDVDIISLDLTDKASFRISRSTVGQAARRGIFFEILYSPAIRDSLFLRNTIINGRHLHSFLRGRNILVSSGCQNAMELRGPYDVQNLVLMFGLTPEQAKNSITLNCSKCIQHSETTGPRVAKRVLSIEKIQEPEVSEVTSGDVVNSVEVASSVTNNGTDNNEHVGKGINLKRTARSDVPASGNGLLQSTNSEETDRINSKKLRLSEGS